MTEIFILMPALNTPAWWRMGCVLGCVLSFGVPGKEVGMPPWGRGKRGMPPRAGRGGNLPAQKGQRGIPPRAKGKWGDASPCGAERKGDASPYGGWGGGSPKAAKGRPIPGQAESRALP